MAGFMVGMKSLCTHAAAVCAMLAVSFAALSQERSGTVRDGKGEPVDLATVALLSGEVHAAVAITDSAGRFVLSVADGDYMLHIRNIAYRPLEQAVRIASGVADLGVWEMEEADFGMAEVVVTASAITRESDRFVMQINNHAPMMMNKDAAEVLRLAPGVWVDDSGLSINGMKGAKVFVNERELRLQGSELTGYLRNFHSSDIARVEVIPQAGAEYGADSHGGIVRIFLRRQMDGGASGHVVFNTSQSVHLSGYNPSATVNVRTGKWTLNTFASANMRTRGEGELTSVRAFNDGRNSDFHSRSNMNRKATSGTGRVGVIYDPDERSSVGVEVEYARSEAKMPSLAETVITGNGGTAASATSDYRQNEYDRSRSATFNYLYRFDTSGSTLKFITDYTDRKVSAGNDYHSRFEVHGAGDPATDSVYRSRASSDYSVFTADLSVNGQFARGMTFSAGAKYTRNRMSDTVRYETLHRLQAWNLLPDYSFASGYTEDIAAVYAVFSLARGGLSLSAGMRGEYTSVNGRRGEIRRSYPDLFPHINATYSFDAMRTYMLIGQYSRNIRRPDFRYLNPNRIQYSDYSYMIGNPDLRPTYMNRFSLTAVYRYRYVLSAGGTMHRDLIREVCRIDPSNADVTFITPENHHTENHFYLHLSFPLQPAEWCAVNVDLTGVKQDIRGTAGDARQSHYLYFNNITSVFTLPAKLHAEVSYSGTSRLYSANSGIEPAHLFHASLKKTFLGERLTASLSVHNIFDRRTAYFSHTPHFTIHSAERAAGTGRHVKVGLQYHFRTGKAFKGRSVESASATERERLGKPAETK
ncbi:MAG: TonB-dependent receptor [Tannerella sp.]|jgi:hypothetical protein|nr:TonB-dependent receptor [Tannerella sp.]